MVVWWIAIAIGAGLAFTALLIAGGALLWRRDNHEGRQVIKRILRLPIRSKLRLAAALFREPRIPWYLRAIPAILVLYLAMPIDLIPDFIPVLGQIDDVAVVIVGVGVLLRFAPREIVESHIALYERREDDERIQ